MKLKKNDVVLIRWKNYYNTGVHNNYELGVIKIIEDDGIRYLKLDMNPLSIMDKMFLMIAIQKVFIMLQYVWLKKLVNIKMIEMLEDMIQGGMINNTVKKIDIDFLRKAYNYAELNSDNNTTWTSALFCNDNVILSSGANCYHPNILVTEEIKTSPLKSNVSHACRTCRNLQRCKKWH